MKVGDVENKEIRVRRLTQFDASPILGTSFPVILHDAVDQKYFAEGEVVSHIVPNVRELIAAVAVSRAYRSLKLSGTEIKFLRKSLSRKAKDFASDIGITPEQLSRYENDKMPISQIYERFLRFAVCLGHISTVQQLGLDPKALLTMKIVSARLCDEPFDFHFKLEPDASETCGVSDAAPTELSPWKKTGT